MRRANKTKWRHEPGSFPSQHKATINGTVYVITRIVVGICAGRWIVEAEGTTREYLGNVNSLAEAKYVCGLHVAKAAAR